MPFSTLGLGLFSPLSQTQRIAWRAAILCALLAGCGAEEGTAADAVLKPLPAVSQTPMPGAQTEAPAAHTPRQEPILDETSASPRAAASTPKDAVLKHVPAGSTPALAAAVTLDIATGFAEDGAAVGTHVRCDGMRIAPNVVLTAAHCFAWHRPAQSDAPPAAVVRIRGTNLAADAAAASALETYAVHVAIHPNYPSLACSQPSHSDAAACLRAASSCVAVHGRDTMRRSACLQHVSEQVIEMQQHGSYDVALVFVAPVVQARQPCAVLVREPQSAPHAQAWLSEVELSTDAWRSSAQGPAAHRAWPSERIRQTSFDITYAQKPHSRVFDGVFAAAPQPQSPVHLIGWASRHISERAYENNTTAVRYTRLSPHLLWIFDTIASVGRAYPALGLCMPEIAD
jgi:hypothetical protein